MKEALKIYAKELESIRESGTYKDERFITCLLYTSRCV